MAPLAIGLALAMIHFASINATGTSVNPARSIGVGLFAGTDAIIQLWLFILAPLLGGGIAGLTYPVLFGGAAPVPGSGCSFGRAREARFVPGIRGPGTSTSRAVEPARRRPGRSRQQQQPQERPAGPQQQPGPAYGATSTPGQGQPDRSTAQASPASRRPRQPSAAAAARQHGAPPRPRRRRHWGHPGTTTTVGPRCAVPTDPRQPVELGCHRRRSSS